jgi:hypothetical protein
LGLRSTQKRRPQPWQRWAEAVPISTMYSKLAVPLRRMEPRTLISLTRVYV